MDATSFLEDQSSPANLEGNVEGAMGILDNNQ